MSKVYTTADLFFTSWAQVRPVDHAVVFEMVQEIKSTDPESEQYGFLLIAILRRLRKNWRLVDKINVAQAVDIFNDLKFLHEPWYYFPKVAGELKTPEEHMARNTFDHFIYGDNEFTSYLATQDVTHLRRLVATLYQDQFDKENVEGIAKALKAKDHELKLVFYTYAQVRTFVMKRCKKLLPTSPKQTEGENEEGVQPTGAMWLTLKHRLAETPVFQGYDNAGKANMYAALDYLEDLAKQKADAST